ncbi:hypothetical protein [Laceyella sediminis]|uniref:hypothetical protein n=1 Tax=Laceyella sediminis TaxID=573074 RepID=UPI0011B24CFD|nr:hypothetical protein [Laceyella sediminis]
MTIHLDEMNLLSPPFRNDLTRITNSLTKRRIIWNWPKDKKRLQRQLYKHDVCTDKEFMIHLASYFNEIKPLLLQSYQEEYPGEHPTPSQLINWMRDCMIVSKLLGRKKELKTWIEIIDMCEWLQEDKLMKI